MPIKRLDGKPIRMVIARPGEYEYSWGTEIKTEEELKKAIALSPTIKLTMGHPKNGVMTPKDFLGYVKPSWDVKERAMVGEVWPYKEHFHKVPKKIAEKIVNGEPWKSSAGFNGERVEDDIQKDVFFDHVAILREGDDPTCPLDKCGINVRQESESGPKMYYEQSSEETNIETETDESTSEPAKEDTPTTSGESPEIEALKQEVADLKLALSEKQETEESSEQKPEIEKVKSPPVPETVIPSGVARTQRWTEVDGRVEIIPNIKKSK